MENVFPSWGGPHVESTNAENTGWGKGGEDGTNAHRSVRSCHSREFGALRRARGGGRKKKYLVTNLEKNHISSAGRTFNPVCGAKKGGKSHKKGNEPLRYADRETTLGFWETKYVRN